MCSTNGEFFNWLLKTLIALGTVGAVVFALFQEEWRRRKYHPTLVVSAITKLPDCVKIPYVWERWERIGSGMQVVRTETTSYYLRVLVKNSGNETARNVEVYAKELNREFKDGRLERVDDFPPMNLIWSNSSPGRADILPFLPPNSSRHCDVGHILDPKDRKLFQFEYRPDLKLRDDEVSLTFDLVQKPLHLGHIVRPGRYRLSIEVAAENFAAIIQQVEINFDGEWNADPQTMFADNLGIKA